MLVLTRRIGQSIMIGQDIELRVVEVKGDQVRLGIIAPADVTVHRREVFDEIMAENRNAAQAAATAPELGLLARHLGLPAVTPGDKPGQPGPKSGV